MSTIMNDLKKEKRTDGKMQVSYQTKPPCLHAVHLGRQRVFKAQANGFSINIPSILLNEASREAWYSVPGCSRVCYYGYGFITMDTLLRDRLVRTRIRNNAERGGKRLEIHSTVAITKEKLNGC